MGENSHKPVLDYESRVAEKPPPAPLPWAPDILWRAASFVMGLLCVVALVLVVWLVVHGIAADVDAYRHPRR